jgi:hypothetical protein
MLRTLFLVILTHFRRKSAIELTIIGHLFLHKLPQFDSGSQFCKKLTKLQHWFQESDRGHDVEEVRRRPGGRQRSTFCRRRLRWNDLPQNHRSLRPGANPTKHDFPNFTHICKILSQIPMCKISYKFVNPTKFLLIIVSLI